jgi:hypothetical protein
MDGGYALRIPVDAIAEFRIPDAERAARVRRHGRRHDERRDALGRHQMHGGLYEFVRNDAFDAKGYFARRRRSSNRTSSAARSAVRLKQDRAFFFGYYEGLRNTAGDHHVRPRCPRRGTRGRLSRA